MTERTHIFFPKKKKRSKVKGSNKYLQNLEAEIFGKQRDIRITRKPNQLSGFQLSFPIEDQNEDVYEKGC